MSEKKRKLLKENIQNQNINTKKLFTNVSGLTFREVQEKILTQNSSSFDNNRSIKNILFTNFFTFFNLLLLIMTIIIIRIKRYEQLIFLFINILNVFLNISQEIRAKKILDKISLLSLNKAKVFREGRLYTVPIKNIVSHDILFLELGSQIVADAYVQKGFLEVNESLLTGESKLVVKTKGDFLYSGSYVVSGEAIAEVSAIGKDMYISKLTQVAKKYKKIQTPLTRSFSYLILVIIFILIPMTLATFYIIPQDMRFENKFILGLCSFILGMMPSGLFLLTTLTLAVGFIKLAKKKAYMKDLFGIEILAQIDVLCLDKTGTITDGSMIVKKVYEYTRLNLNFPQLMHQLVMVFPRNNPTQKALYNKFALNNINVSPFKIVASQSFSSFRKYSAVEFEKKGTFLLGAPEFILKKQFEEIKDRVASESQLGYRVLLLAQTNTPLKLINVNTHYQIISLILLEEHIKFDAFSTLEYFRQNNIQIKIISGDNANTIAYIARKLNIIQSNQQVINLTNIKNQQQISELSLKYDVFGRSTPEQKQIILQSLKKNNFKVAMIGDGVNDILAFKEADISIAMASGSKAAQNVANLVMIDSQFSSLPQVVTEGRRVINNLKKISVLFLVKTISVFGFSLINFIFNFLILNYALKQNFLPFPFTPLQLNLIDVFFIGIPSFFLSLENNNQKIQKNFLKNVLYKSFPYSFLIILNYLFFIWRTNFNITNISALIHFFTAITFFYLLIDNCRPLNKWKFLLIMLMLFSFIFCIQIIPNNQIHYDILRINNLGLQSYELIYLIFVNAIFFIYCFLKQNKNLKI
ncbi:MAG: HAD-IC family P-type ATPase [Vigna little leaf phytoplasma]|nr:HAD-IC family P-type ATPase [Vigna little leaf phytoplasma]